MNHDVNDNFPAEKVLKFWFEESKPEQWFIKDDKFDDAIRQQFADVTERAQQEHYPHDSLDDRAKLALIIVLDQFSRNIYRDTPKAFAGDAQALALTKHLLQKHAQGNFSQQETAFLYMPLEHSETLADQELAVSLFEKLGDEDNLHYAILHRDIIKRFGRFPHRNAILGRTSTAEEEQFLTEPNSSF